MCSSRKARIPYPASQSGVLIDRFAVAAMRERKALNQSSQRAITRTRAVCGVEFLANIQILAAKSALQPIPIRAPRFCED
jgi:hypothetical protein